MREKLSAFVVTHNRAALLESCLRAARFADEVIVVDKSSTDGSAKVAARIADRVETVPWSPTVEETRAYAASLCRHDWILCLDDDEILSPETAAWWRDGFDPADADIVAIPLRHYILGVHDERAYYWPEAHNRLFRKDAIAFIPVVHGGVATLSNRIATIPPDSGVCIHHLSYSDVASWVERANRYTSRPNRVRPAGGEGDLIGFAHERIGYWLDRSHDRTPDGYPAAVALLRAIYDMVDALKTWEAARGLDGAALFREAQARLVPREAAAMPRGAEPGADGIAAGRAAPLNATGGSAGDMREIGGTGADMRKAGGAAADTGKTGGAGADTRKAAAAAVNPPETGDAVSDAAIRGLEVRLCAAEAEARERGEAARLAGAVLAETRAALAGVEADLCATAGALAEATEALANRSRALERADAESAALRAALDGAHADLADSWARLSDAHASVEALSGSARRFLRAYWPRLRMHLRGKLRGTGSEPGFAAVRARPE